MAVFLPGTDSTAATRPRVRTPLARSTSVSHPGVTSDVSTTTVSIVPVCRGGATATSVACTVDAVNSALLDWLDESWPAHGWARARVAHGCFHDAAVLEPEVVARVSRHGEQAARVRREHEILAVVEAAGLPVAVPRNASGVVVRGGRAGMLTTFVPGKVRGDAPWEAVGPAARSLLAALSRADVVGTVRGLPGPRAWCGGAAWQDVVREQLVPRLPAGVRAAAVAAVAGVLEAERGVRPALVHGDLGPHNLPWEGERVVGLLDFDHSCAGDPAIDAATLIGAYGAAAVGEIVDGRTLERGMVHRASLALQLAAAAHELGDGPLRDHALGNFARRASNGTLHDPGGRVPAGPRS